MERLCKNIAFASILTVLSFATGCAQETKQSGLSTRTDQVQQVNSSPVAETFASQEEKFRIVLPPHSMVLQDKGDVVKTKGGSKRTFSWSAPKCDVTVMVNTDESGIIAAMTTEQQNDALTHVLESGFKAISGKAVSDEVVAVGKARARKVTVETSSGALYYVLALIRSNKTYLVVCVPRKEFGGSELTANEILISFSLIDE